MNDLAAISSSALLGTERSPLPPLENAHLEQVRQKTASNNAAQLLSVALLAHNMARAGQAPAAAQPASQPAPLETQRTMPQAASTRLNRLFAESPELIPEWLGLAAQRGYVVAHEHVIALLEYGRQHTERRTQVLPLLGARGRWLAQQNTYWEWAAGDTSSAESTLETWETGSKAARVLALGTLRAANPEQARTLLQAVWKSEPADERKTFLAQFEQGLTDADEPFLEMCLDDRSKDVRGIAADLLAKLPNSAFVGRMQARAEKLLQKGKKELEVTLPEWEDAFARDALEKKSPLYNVGDKAYWWQTIVSRVPAAFWQQHSGLVPSDILKRLPKEWKSSFVAAIMRQSLDAIWLETLLLYDRNLIANNNLMKLVSLERRENYVRQFIFGQTSGKPMTDVNWVTFMRHDWSVEFSQAVWHWLLAVGEKILDGANEYSYFAELAHHIAPETVSGWQNNPKMQHLFVQLEIAQETKKSRMWHLRHCLEQYKTLFVRLQTRAQMRKEFL